MLLLPSDDPPRSVLGFHVPALLVVPNLCGLVIQILFFSPVFYYIMPKCGPPSATADRQYSMYVVQSFYHLYVPLTLSLNALRWLHFIYYNYIINSKYLSWLKWYYTNVTRYYVIIVKWYFLVTPDYYNDNSNNIITYYLSLYI